VGPRIARKGTNGLRPALVEAASMTFDRGKTA
jgi:hypothetical protein